MNIVKNAVNFNHVIYDFKTKRYYVRDSGFSDYKEAKANQWQCEKCEKAFSSYRDLRLHKIEIHSY